MENSRIKVRIYGQEYTIVGERPEDEIRRTASYVDERMHYIAQNSNIGSTSSLAVLSAVNIADELFEYEQEMARLQAENEQLTKDNRKFAEMWDDAKKTVIEYRKEIEELRVKASDDKGLSELQDKYKELEANYFDLQMENIKLKSENAKLNR